jgi:DcaP outer membrane protein
MFVALFLQVAVSHARAQTTPVPTQSLPMPRLDIYGFVMTDFGYDIMQNDPNWFDVTRPTKLPSFKNEFGRNGRTYAGVRQTRFGVRANEDTPLGELKVHFEFDFFGVGVDAGQTTFRPRFFYAEVGAFGAGQTNSAFMDFDVSPNILDYWWPCGEVFFRNVQVRWMPIRGDTQLTIALERPGSTQDPGTLADRIEIQNISGRFPLPDLTGNFRYGGKRGHIQASGIVRKTKLDDLLPNDRFNLDDSVLGWGAALSGNLKIRKDVLRLQNVVGDGVENYMSDAPIDIAPAPNFGNPVKPIRGRALPLQSLVAFLDHTWNSKWTSSAGYSQLAVSNTVLQRPDDFHRGQYAIANLLYTPTEHILYGVEAQWARRTNFGDGFHANDYRVQFGFRYNFAAQIGGVK